MMPRNKYLGYIKLGLVCIGYVLVGNSYAMGLRSLVALPVEEGGVVVRFAFERVKNSQSENLTTSMAYGINAKQTMLFGLPYRISPTGNNRQGDVSALYRHIVWQEDSFSGTDRLGLLGGVVIPTENNRDAAVQAGFVFTHVKNRHEFDIDALYQAGLDNRADSGRYDLSWQYRLSPTQYPDWGIGQELNSVLELNGRWNEGNAITHQVTAGLQWIHQKFVVEGGITKDINNAKDTRYLVSFRFHF